MNGLYQYFAVFDTEAQSHREEDDEQEVKRVGGCPCGRVRAVGAPGKK
jgi:hypothetical protein